MTTIHLYLDEAGDTTFTGRKGKIMLGREGVSKAFILGCVEVFGDHSSARSHIKDLQSEIERHPYLNTIPSVKKKIDTGGFFLHAKDDPPEVRTRAYELIQKIDCKLTAIVGRKQMARFTDQHQSNESLLYADLLSHILKNRLDHSGKIVLTVAYQGKSTKMHNLEHALEIAIDRYEKNVGDIDWELDIHFNVQYPRTEPLLNLADYLCWAVQRVFERGDIRHYDYCLDKIDHVLDLWDTRKYKDFKNYYNKINPLTVDNKLP